MAAKTAWKEKMKLLGNRKRRLEELAREAAEDPVFKEVFEGKQEIMDQKPDNFLKMLPTYNAEKLVKGIEKHIGFGMILTEQVAGQGKKEKLVYPMQHILKPNLCDNALLAIVYLGLDRKEEAEQIMRGIDRHFHIEDKTGLAQHDMIIREGKTESKSLDNCLLAIAFYGIGMKSTAEQIIESVESEFGIPFDTTFIKRSRQIYHKIYAMDNAALAIAYSLLGRKKDAKILVDSIKHYFEFQHSYDYDHPNLKWLGYNIKDEGDRWFPNKTFSTSTNALFAVAEYCVDEVKEALDIYQATMVENGPTELTDRCLPVGDCKDDKYRTFPSAATALMCMVQRYYLENEN